MIHLHFVPWTPQSTQRPPESSLLLHETNVAPLNCGGILPPVNQEPLLCFITSETPQTPQMTVPDGPQKWLPNCLHFPFPLSLAGKLTLEGSWWQQHTETRQSDELNGHRCPFPPFSEAALAGTQRSKERGGGGMKSKGIQGIHSHPLPRGWGVAAYPPNLGHTPLYPARSQSFPSRNHCAKMHNDNTCSKVFEPACSALNKEIILVLPPENPESTKGRQGSRRRA